MKSKYGKQRLFEVMGKLDKTFKPTLKEDVNLGELNIDEILNSYLETALWAEESEENDLKDKTIYDVDKESVVNSKIEIYNFIKKAQQEAP